MLIGITCTNNREDKMRRKIVHLELEYSTFQYAILHGYMNTVNM